MLHEKARARRMSAACKCFHSICYTANSPQFTNESNLWFCFEPSRITVGLTWHIVCEVKNPINSNFLNGEWKFKTADCRFRHPGENPALFILANGCHVSYTNFKTDRQKNLKPAVLLCFVHRKNLFSTIQECGQRAMLVIFLKEHWTTFLNIK